MKKTSKSVGSALCSLASAISSGALMVSNVSAATITYYSGTPANDGEGTSVLAPTLHHYDYSSRSWEGDSAYRGPYNIGSVIGVLDDASASEEGIEAFEDIARQGFEFENWKTSYYTWSSTYRDWAWIDNGTKTPGTNFSSTDYNLKAVAQWTDLKNPVLINDIAAIAKTPFVINLEEDKLGEITFDYDIKLASEAEEDPVQVSDIDENFDFIIAKEGYEYSNVTAKIGEAEPIDITADVQDDGKVTLENVKQKDVAIAAEMNLKQFDVAATVSDTDHAHVEPKFEGKITYGEPAAFKVIVEAGYKAVSVRESGGNTGYEVIDGELAIDAVKDNLNLNIMIEPEEYIVMEGEDQVFDATKDENLVIRFSGELDQFKELHIDGELIDEEYYKTEAGSVIVAIDGKFIAANYGEGTHEVEAIYKNGNSAETTFEIPAPKTPDTGANSISSAPIIASVLACAATGSVLSLAFFFLKRKMNR